MLHKKRKFLFWAPNSYVFSGKKLMFFIASLFSNPSASLKIYLDLFILFQNYIPALPNAWVG